MLCVNDLIILEDDDLDNIFDLVNDFQIVFHPYYAMEGKFTHYKEYLMNKKYGQGKWSRGAKTEYNALKKWFDRIIRLWGKR